MKTPLRLLIVEDSEDDVLLLVRQLKRSGYDVTFERIENAAAMNAALEQQPWDLVIDDYSVPGFNGLTALALFKEKGLDLPFIIVSGTIGEEIAVEAMKAGAHDYVMKSHLARLIPAIERELREAEIRRARKRAEQALRESEERYRALFRDNPAMYFTLDAGGKVIAVNQFGASQLGYTIEELEGQSVLNVFHEQDRAAVTEQLETCLRHLGQVNHWQFRNVRKDGSFIWVEEFARSVTSPDGTLHVLVVCHDITERKQAEEALRQAKKLESLGILAGGIAHDFNNLLVAILGQTSLALEQLPIGVPARSSVEKSVKAAQRAADLTRQLLAYSGHGQLQVVPLNLNTLIQDNLHFFEVAIPKNVQLQSELTEPLPAISGDVSQLQQVIMNLIINSAEAIGQNSGAVVVTTGTLNIAPADIHGWQYVGPTLTPGAYVTVAVQDNGCGMDAATLSKVFDPFFTTKFTGRGLGLAAVLGIVRSHKGGLRVDSEVDKGTTFTLCFPISTAQPATATLPETTRAAGTPHSLVLVIDDEEPVREAVTDILESEGLAVITAADGEAGLALYRERPADIRLVLLDLSMPGMSGEETLRELQKINPDVQVVVSSGYSQTGIAPRFEGMKLASFLQKPYDAETLIDKIRRLLD